MKRLDNPELKRRIIKHLADKYKILEVREPNHLSSYVYCRTKGFLDQKQATEPSETEIMLFAIGYGLQDVLTPKDAVMPTYTKNGIIYRPDMVFEQANLNGAVRANVPIMLTELKTTRKSAKYHFIDEHLPETWIAYMQGGCHLTGNSSYDLIILYMMGNYSPPFPDIYADTIIFEEAEIESNWQMILHNKEVLDTSLKTGVMPAPFQNCYEWECKYCRYQLVCQAMAGKYPSSRNMQEEDVKLWS